MPIGQLYEIPGHKQWVVVQHGGQLLTWWRGVDQSWRGGEPLATTKSLSKVVREKELKGYAYVKDVEVDINSGHIETNGAELIVPSVSALEALFYVTGSWSVDELIRYLTDNGVDVVRGENTVTIGNITFSTSTIFGVSSTSTSVPKAGTKPEVLVAILSLCKAGRFRVTTEDAEIDLFDISQTRTLLEGWVAEGAPSEILQLAEEADVLPKPLRISASIKAASTGSIFF